jgi:hypothetical protein
LKRWNDWLGVDIRNSSLALEPEGVRVVVTRQQQQLKIIISFSNMNLRRLE